MSGAPQISCVVPVHNAESFVAEALDSLVSQTLPPAEIVVVDDGSTDGTGRVVESYGAPVVLVHQENAGAAAARNRGLDEVRGAFVAFLDADDIALPERLEAQMARFEARPELDVCIAHIENFWEDAVQEKMKMLGDNPYLKPMAGTVTQAGLVRTGIFDTIRFDAMIPIGHDQDWHLRAREEGMVIEIIPDILVKRRMHAASLIHSGENAIQQDMFLWVKKALDRRRPAGP